MDPDYSIVELVGSLACTWLILDMIMYSILYEFSISSRDTLSVILCVDLSVMFIYIVIYLYLLMKYGKNNYEPITKV